MKFFQKTFLKRMTFEWSIRLRPESFGYSQLISPVRIQQRKLELELFFVKKTDSRIER